MISNDYLEYLGEFESIFEYGGIIRGDSLMKKSHEGGKSLSL
jgi:hypothetical protein